MFLRTCELSRFLLSNSVIKRFSKALRRMNTTEMETKVEEPMRIRKKSMNCCQVLSVDKLTVFSPASVIAETQKNNESTKLTLLEGVDEPQNIMADRRVVNIKYA